MNIGEIAKFSSSLIGKEDGRVWVLIFPFSILSLIGFVGGILFPLWPTVSSIILWALASLVSGLLAGFLFGIPKVLQGKGSISERRQEGGKSDLAQESSYQQQVNTNLTEISDWVTKIIVGLGLINLKEIPGKLLVAGDLFAKAFPADSHVSAVPLGISIVIAFIAIGFLFGYLTTRLVLAGKLAIADIEAQAAHEKAESNTAQLDSLRGEVSFIQTKLSAGATQITEKAPGSGATTPPSEPVQPEGELKETILKLADAYTHVDNPSWSERVRLKDLAADRIANFCQEHSISRDWLVQQILEAPNDGLIVSLATLINASPESRDVDRILKVAKIAHWKHTRYRIVLALVRIIKARMVPSSLMDEVENILDMYDREGDDSLKASVRQARSLSAQVKSFTNM
jgi:hypothetical protein